MSENIKIEQLREFKGTDLQDICDATEKTLLDGLGFTIGFNWQEPPSREFLESYWKGVCLVPERLLYVGRVDGTIASGVQITKPSPSNKAGSFYGKVTDHFVAPWARGHGLAPKMITAMEADAKRLGYTQLRSKIRNNKQQVQKLYESFDYKKYGELEKFELNGNSYISGSFYYKDL